ncbi:MAG: PAS domain S-box protein [Bacteroidota bacterium]
MTDSRNIRSIEQVKEEVIHNSLIVASILGSTAFLTTSFFRYLNNNFNVSLIFESLVLAVLLIVTLRREKISVSTKAYIMVALVLILSLSDIYIYGLLSSTRIYLVLVPLYTIIYFPFSRSLIIYLIAMISFLVIGYFHGKGILQIPRGYEPDIYLFRVFPWLINALHISAVGLIILYLTRKFFVSFSGFIGHLRAQNKVISDNERNYREVFNSTSEAIFIHDASDGRICDVNDVMLRMFGYETKEEVLSLTLRDISAENNTGINQKARQLIQKAIEEGPQVFEWHSKRKNGELFYSEISLKSTEIGGKGRVLAVLRDVTERKMSEQALNESEARYRIIIEAFPEIIMVSDLNGKIIFANSALGKITGITPEEYNNPERKARIYHEDTEYVRSEIEKLLSGPDVHTSIIENRFEDAWGNVRWFSGIISKIYFDNQLYLQTISRDVTAKKQAEEQLERYKNHLEALVQERTEELEATNEELMAANDELISKREELEATLKKLQQTQKQLVQSEKMASLGVLAAGIAHELNNPLNFIKGGVTAIETYVSDSFSQSSEISKLIEVVNEGVARASLIVSGLNHYSRKNDRVFVESDIHGVIENCLIILQNQIKNTIAVERIYVDQPLMIHCNEGKIHQAILNLLTNAVQAITNKGTITIKTQLNKNNLHLSISDTGVGIAGKNMKKIFDPFFTTKDPGKGTGLGLFITHGIIEEHGGKIHFESEYGKGTTVYVSIPVR